MMRWTDALMLGTALACLIAWTSSAGCEAPKLGAIVDPPTPWHDAIDALVADWRASDLPSIDTPRCAHALATLEIRIPDEMEWIDQLRLCPLMPDGCHPAPGCAGVWCATGTVGRRGGVWAAYLSPGENADGHAITARHEAAHVLSWCVGRGLDHTHSHDDVWASGMAPGVVWCGCPREVDP